MKILCILLSLISLNAIAATTDADGVYCKAFVYNDVANKFTYADLATAKYDDKFMEATINQYGLGADKFFLKSDGGIGMVISDNGTKNGTVTMAGWRTVAKTQMADINFFVVLKDKSRDQVQITCYRDL